MSPRIVRVAGDGPGLAQAVNGQDGADLVLIGENVIAPDDVIERLNAAAEDTTTATASALDHGDAVAIAAHPRIPVPAGGCVLVRRWALDLAGPLDGSYVSAQ